MSKIPQMVKGLLIRKELNQLIGKSLDEIQSELKQEFANNDINAIALRTTKEDGKFTIKIDNNIIGFNLSEVEEKLNYHVKELNKENVKEVIENIILNKLNLKLDA